MKALKVVGIIVAIVIVLVIVVPFLVPVNQFRPTIEQKASAALGRQVTVGNLSLSLITGSLAADNLAIADDPKFEKGPFLTAKSIKVGVRLIPLIFSKELDITNVEIDNPAVTLLRNPAGQWNYSTFGTSGAKAEPKRAAAANGEKPKAKEVSYAEADNKSASETTDFSVGKLALRNGTIVVGTTTSQKRSTYSNVDLTATDVSPKTKFPVTLTASLPGGGSLKLDGNVGPEDPNDAAITPVDAKLNVNGLNLATTGFLDPSLGLGGMLDLDASLASQNGQARLNGTTRLSKALLVQGGSPAEIPADVNFRTTYDLRKNTGVLEPSTIKIGAATANLTGTYEVPDQGMILHVKMNAENMPAPDLAKFLPAVAVHLPAGSTLVSGTMNANLQSNGPTNKLVTTGNASLFKAKLANFDFGSKLASLGSITGIKTPKDLDIEKMTTDVRIAPDGIEVQNFQAVLAGIGTLVGNGTIDARNQLDFKAAITLGGGSATTASAGQPQPNETPGGGSSGGIGGLLGRVTGGAAGNLLGSAGGVLRGCKGTTGPAIPFQIKGTTKDPKFVPDVGGLAAGVLKSQLGCAGGAVPKAGQQGQNQKNPANAVKGLFKKPF